MFLEYLKKIKFYLTIFLISILLFFYIINIKNNNIQLKKELLLYENENVILKYNLMWQEKALFLKEEEKYNLANRTKESKEKLAESYEKEELVKSWADADVPDSVHKLLCE